MRNDAEARLKRELQTMEGMAADQNINFGQYFLVVADITDAARDRGIWVGPGRGSAAGSIVAYLLGITNIDPLRYDLLFERFLNPERATMPDIDLDIGHRRRPELIDYVLDRHGRERVAQIGAFGRMKTRTCIKDVARAAGVPYDLAETLTDAAWDEPTEKEFDPNWADRGDVQQLASSDDRVRAVVENAPRFFGWARHFSAHPCGLIISPGPITDYVPVTQTKSKGKKAQTTQYEGKYMEDLGLLKMDLLGLNTGSILMTAVDFIEENHGVRVDLEQIMDDPERRENAGALPQGRD